MPQRPVFVSYNSRDRAAAVELVEALDKRSVATFFDRRNLIPGQPWPQALEASLEACGGVAVLIGAGGLGLWQKREMGYALDRQVREEKIDQAFPVIPVLLPGADPGTGFLFLNTWIEYPQNDDGEAVADGIVRALNGESGDLVTGRTAICPYLGLRAFNEDSASFFVGRDAETQRLFEAVLEKRMSVVVGASGSGKSSLVQAGLLPRLRRERPPADTWDCALCRPGAQPYRALAIAIQTLLQPDQDIAARLSDATRLAHALQSADARLAEVAEQVLTASGGTDRLLIVVDQFEEIFTQTGPTLAASFSQLLADAVDEGPVRLVLTLRADYYGHVLALGRDFGRRLESATVNLGPMTRAGLHDAIVLPARRLGLEFESGLAGKILDDVGNEPGRLPLLQFALTELWSQRENNRITHRAYEAIGSVAGAIARRADQVVAGLATEEKDLIRGLFTRLVTLTPATDGSGATRRKARLDQIEPVTRAVARRLADSRLLVIDSEGAPDSASVELAHEAIIRHWDRLGRWLDEDREFLLWRQRLGLALDQWRRTGKDDGAVLRGLALGEAERWQRERRSELSPEETGFIAASSAVRIRLDTERQRRRRLRFMALASGLVVALALGALATLQWWRASEQRAKAERLTVRAEARRLAAESEARLADSVDELEQAILLGIESQRRHPDVAGERALRRALALRPQALRTVHHRARVRDVLFSPDGRLLATAGDDGMAALVDVKGDADVVWLSHLIDSGRFVSNERGFSGSVMGYKEEVRALAFSPDSRLLGTGNSNGMARVWRVQNGDELLRITHGDRVDAVAFSPDGQFFASGSYDGTARLIALPGGETIATIRHSEDEEVRDLGFSPDGRWLATVGTDGWARIVNGANGERLHKLALGDVGLVLAWSPDSATLATAAGASVHLWNAASGERLASVEHRDYVGNRSMNAGSSYVFTLKFSPDGEFLLTGSRDGTARVWSVANGSEVIRVDQRYEILDVAFAPDGRRFVTGSFDGTARVWETLSGRELLRASGNGSAHAVAFSPNGSTLATGAADGTATLWGVTGGGQAARLAHDLRVEAVGFAPDNETLATIDQSGGLRLWRFLDGQLLADAGGGGWPNPSYAATRVAFSDDGSRLLAWGKWNKLHVFDMRDGLAHTRTISAYSRDGFAVGARFAATVDREDVLTLWSLDRDEPLGTLPRNDIAGPIGLRADEGALYAYHKDRSLRIYQIPSLTEIASFALRSRPDAVALGRSGRFVAIASGKRLVLHRTTPAQRVVLDEGSDFVAAFFTPDEQSLIAVREQHISVWSTEDGERLFERIVDSQPRDLALSRDGSVLALAEDNLVQLIDASSGQTLARLHPTSTVLNVEFSADGDWLAIVLHDQSVTAWRWRADELVALACDRLTRNFTAAEWQRQFPDALYAKTCTSLPTDPAAISAPGDGNNSIRADDVMLVD